MTKNLDERGETKSGPQEIAKLPRHTCGHCGLSGPATMIIAASHDGTKVARCRNEAACDRRILRAQKRQGFESAR